MLRLRAREPARPPDQERIESDRVVADWTPAPHHKAFDGYVSGGILGVLFDCHRNWATVHFLMQAKGLTRPPDIVLFPELSSCGYMFHVDIFLDKLEFSHDVEFGKKPGDGRLELDSPTISLTDIVLEKLQIHKIARKDLVDLMILFFGHDVKPMANGEKEAVDAGYISGLMADDWGFWYDATQNLAKVRQLMGTFVGEGRMKPEAASRIEARVGALEAGLRAVPKGRHWEKRSKVGTAKPWYREVEEVVR